MSASKVSAIIVARDAEEIIKECLESLRWASEIILVDDGSKDQTLLIAKKYGAKIIQIRGGDFSSWRNTGAKVAAGEWLLYVDADERVTPQLKKEILSKTGNWKSGTGNSAFAIPRKNILLGKKMRFGGWWPDYVLRLIKKDALIGWEGKLHEQPKIKGEVGKLQEPFIHITHRNLSEMIEKTNQWSEIEAKLLYQSHHPKMNWWRFCSVALREFWYRGIKKAGFLDGTEGVIEIIYQVFSRLISYAKLWEMQIKNESRNL